MENPAIATIGLVSDTHYQQRLFDLPTTLEDCLAGVDLILHAGDVGELDVIDQLGKIAPLIAVHGNDEPDHVQQSLPYQQLVMVHGVRILLWHSHYADPIEEKANRKGSWGPKLEHIASRAREVNVQVVVYGHTHVPMIYQCDDVLLVNPGALTGGSYFTRQVIRSVAKLQVYDNGEIDVKHFDIVTGQERVFDVADSNEDFDVLAGRYQEWIVEPLLIPIVGRLRKMAFEDIKAVLRSLSPLHKHCLSSGDLMRVDDLIDTIHASDQITFNDQKNILDAIYFAG